jgi:hypothetical protein
MPFTDEIINPSMHILSEEGKALPFFAVSTQLFVRQRISNKEKNDLKKYIEDINDTAGLIAIPYHIPGQPKDDKYLNTGHWILFVLNGRNLFHFVALIITKK